MAGITIAKAENLLVRVEAGDGAVGWGEAPSAPTMTGDTLGGLVAAVRDHLAPLLIGKDAERPDSSRDAAPRARRQHRRAFGGRDGAARSCGPRGAHAPDRSRGGAPRRKRRADVAARQRDAGAGHRRGARQAGARASVSSSSRSASSRSPKEIAATLRGARGAGPRRRSAPTPIAG